MMRWLKIGIAAALVAILCLLGIQQRQIHKLMGERDRYKSNNETLLSDVEFYRVRDSLSAARVFALELTNAEYERFRAEDAALIRQLVKKNRDLSAVNKTQTATIIELQSRPRDTTIIRDSMMIPAVAVHCGDAWFDFDGILTKDEFTGTLEHRDSLILAESVKYHRFLGFLWKTKRVEDRQLDVVTKSPHTKILNIEHTVIEK